MAIDEVLDYITRKRILGMPSKCIAKKELDYWILPEDAQVDTGAGIKSFRKGTVIIVNPYYSKDIFFMSELEFNQLYVQTEGSVEDEIEEAASREEDEDDSLPGSISAVDPVEIEKHEND